jgi:hypothetical protein
MSVNRSTKQQQLDESSEVRGPIAAASRKSVRKMPGTRAGTIEDWRAGDAKRAGESSRRGKRLRDGR